MKSLSIRQKIWLAIITVSSFTIIIAVSLSYYLYEKLYLEKQLETLMLQGQNLEDSFYENTREAFLQQLEWMQESSESNIIFTDDPMLLGSGAPFDSLAEENLISFAERQELLKGHTVHLIRMHAGLNQEVIAVVLPLLENNRLKGVIFLYLPITAIAEAFQPIRLFLVSGLAVLLLLLLAVGTKITNELVKPIQNMDEVARKIANGDYSERVQADGSDELARLASSINTLSANLEEVDRKRREFLGNVSHELRTPISYMKGYSEAVVEGIITSKKYVEIIHKETNRMNRLVHDLLDLAQLEGDSYPIHDEPIVLSELIQEVLSRFELKLNEKGLTSETTLNEEIIVKGDSDRLDQVLTNLFSNAIRYSEEQKKIFITLRQTEYMAELTIEDQGIGIPKEDLPQVFERFYRVNKARTRQDGGTGLGLSIVQQIVKKHGGDIIIESEKNIGTKVTVKLPIFSF